MLFNSLQFALFLPVVFILYWFVLPGKLKLQNLLLLAASYFFYSCWDFRFLFLLVFSTLLDYSIGLAIDHTHEIRPRKILLFISIVVNLGFLAAFKYYNFFIHSFETALNNVGFKSNFHVLNLVLPVGISFYTFHGLSYVIDIYKKRIPAVKNFIVYSLFVSFFPLLVAGPIERATHLLPQLENKRRFDYAKSVEGLKQILWGIFKKVVIADACAVYVNKIFEKFQNCYGSTLAIGSILFAFQIYCDFSGYSDVAIGTAKLFNIDLLRNFAFPYFSRDIAEFWRRWHISLSSWFKDYVYIPLGGNSGSLAVRIRNVFIIFILSGLWHGGNWTFIVWGALNAIYFIPLVLLKRNRRNLDIVSKGKLLPSGGEMVQMISTFMLTCFAWIFFRSATIGQAILIVKAILSRSIFFQPQIFPIQIILLLVLFIIIEWKGREQQFAIQQIGIKLPRFYRWAFYNILLLFILFSSGKEQPFIYFQF
ncbi:MAG: MBOAT family protein [Bacteroidota bacterium]|nr:MBOAT family protein [Bacteroidota bacterium]